jgi:hypothetical protein
MSEPDDFRCAFGRSLRPVDPHDRIHGIERQ